MKAWAFANQGTKARVTRALASFPDEDVARTMPVLLLAIATEFGVDALEPDVQALLGGMLFAAGFSLSTTCLEDLVLLKRYQRTAVHRVNGRLLRMVQRILREHTGDPNDASPYLVTMNMLSRRSYEDEAA